MPEQREDIERLARCIIRNPFAVEKMQVSPPNQANPDGSIIYRSELNPKIQRNFEVFTPCDFILTPPSRFGYRLPHESAPSGQSQRACARAACKAISYQ